MNHEEVFDDEYELIKLELLSHIISFDRLEILRKRGYTETEIDEILNQGPSWYTQTSPPILKNKTSPSLINITTLRKQVCVWFVEDYGLTKSQEKLNKELLNIIKCLDWYDEDSMYEYDNGSVGQLEEFLEDNKSNSDLKFVLNLKRGVSDVTVLHAVSGARVYEDYRNQEDRAVSLLLAAGADRNARDNEGETPLHYAAAIGNSEGVSSLLRRNADPSICCKQGKTPQQVAIDGGYCDVAKLLLTKEQEELRRDLYNILTIPIFGPIRFTKTLKEFLDKHKSNPDLKVVLNIRSERGKSEALELAENITYIDTAVAVEIENLFLEAGASYGGVVKKKHPLALLPRLTPDRQKELDSFLDGVSKAEDMDKLKEVIDEAIRSRVQLNFNKYFSQEDLTAGSWYSLTDWTLKRIGELSKLKRNPEIASDIVCNLISRGAIFRNRNSIDVIDKLELEFKYHKRNTCDAYAEHIENAYKLIKVARGATSGRLNDARIDNATFYLEYSENSTVSVEMITDGVRDLELNQKDVGYSRNIIKIGKSEVDLITEDGIRNYTNLADNSDIVLTFYTSKGELEVRLFPDRKNKDLIMVKVSNQDLLKQLGNCKEELGKNCLLGGYSVYNAIDRGCFERSSSEPKTWVDKVQESRKNQRGSIIAY